MISFHFHFLRLLVIASLFYSIAFDLQAQSRGAARAQWFHLDPKKDSVAGISTDRAYSELLKGRKGQPVIVAVIDAGVDVEHEDLKSVLWNNSKETNNKVDDDKNGYIDDVHGWNFIGNKDGRNVNHDTYEEARIYKSLKPQYEGKQRSVLSKAKQKEFDLYQKVKQGYEKNIFENTSRLQMITGLYDNNKKLSDTLKSALRIAKLDTALLIKPPTKDSVLKTYASSLYKASKRFQVADADKVLEMLADYQDHYRELVDSSLNLEVDTRQIVGDNYNNLKEKYYGNGNAEGPDPKHGTHVAGIIAADRNNANECQGVADHAKIMSVRAVPNGDERDKDIANAIRYAVDNGAKIINMSFGKPYSPEKKVVDKAFKYAAKKDVLIVKAAGNSASNNDTIVHYPSKYNLKGKEFKNVIDVGASFMPLDSNLVAPFSNYGKRAVDVFAPGMQIYATLPGGGYGNLSGTSMASPVVAGIAAVLKSYFPQLTALDLKRIIVNSAVRYNINVIAPGTGESVKFSELSRTGALVNLYEAVSMAMKEMK